MDQREKEKLIGGLNDSSESNSDTDNSVQVTERTLSYAR